VLVHRRHHGPLQVQKALYPESGGICHVAVLHPPGGIAGGDRLEITAALDGGSHALLTTPGASKWYRSAGDPASQHIEFAVDGDAVLEWLPRETILFDESRASLDTQVRLSGAARFLGWEILCFGRRASGERWRHGALALRTRVVHDGRLLWSEIADVAADGGFAESPVGLGGASVSGTFLIAGCTVPGELLAACRLLEPAEAQSRFGLTPIPGMLIARYLGHSSEQAFRWFAALWSLLRPAVLGRPAQAPRLWAC
jgi:urease accessory protein